MNSAAPDTSPERFLSTDNLQKDLKGRAVRGGAVTMLAQGGKFIFQLINMVVLARLLTPHDFGLVGMVTSIVGFLIIFKDLGLSAATVQRPEITHAQVSTLFWINAGFGLLLALLTLAAAPLVAAFYHEPELAVVTAMLAWGFLFSGISVQHQALLRRQMRFGTVMSIDLIALAIGTSTGVVMAWLGYGYWALVGTQLSLLGVSAIASWIACGWRPGRWVRECGVGEMLGFGGNLAAFRMTSYWIQNVDNVLIGRIWGSQQLGFYMRAYQLLVMPLSQINAPIGEVAIPMLSRMTGDADKYRQAYGMVLQAVALLTLPVVVVTIGAADWVVRVVLGAQWLEAADIFMWLGIMALAEPVRYSTSYLFISQARTREMLYAELISGVVLITAICIGVQWGAKGVAASFALSSLLIRTPVVLWFAGRAGPVKTRDIYSTAAPFLSAALVALASVIAFRRFAGIEHPVVGLIIATVLTLLVIAATLWMLPAGRRSLHGLKSLLPLLRKKGKAEAVPE